jgi:glycosyltransferase involved in cell wall biosynthesis
MLSVIIPVFNEEESLSNFYEVLIINLSKLGKDSPRGEAGYEVIFVDDGSTDKTLEILKDFKVKNKNVKVFSFRRNQGKAEALTFGFQKAQGDYVVTLDADMQDKPKEISKLLKKATEENWDVVCGWRKERKDSIGKVFSSKLFNFIASIFWGLKLHDYNCGLKLYTKDAAKSLNLYGGMHRFIPLLAHEQGFRVTEVAVEHGRRKYGKSKYGFSKIWKDLPDIFTMLFLSKYSKRPFHFFGVAGAFLVLLGVVILGYLTYLRILGQTIGQRPLLFFGMLLVISGFQLFFTGFLADLIINVSPKESKSFSLKYSSERL